MSSEMSLSPLASASGSHLINKLRPYQREVALAILDSIFGRKGLTFSVVKGTPSTYIYHLDLIQCVQKVLNFTINLLTNE